MILLMLLMFIYFGCCLVEVEVGGRGGVFVVIEVRGGGGLD